MGLKNLAFYNPELVFEVTPPSTGTAATLAVMPTPVLNGHQFGVKEDEQALTRRTYTAKVRPSTYDPKTKTVSRTKKSLSFAHPFLGNANSVTYRVCRIEIEHDSEATPVDITGLRQAGIAMISSSELDDFFNYGSLEL